MKRTLLITLPCAALAFMPVHDASAAAFVVITPYAENNGPVTQVDITNATNTAFATSPLGSWTSTGFGYKIAVEDEFGNPLEINGGTEFTFTIDSTGPSAPLTANFGGLTFLGDPNSPSVVPYRADGTVVNSLIGQPVSTPLNGLNVSYLQIGGPEILAGFNASMYDLLPIPGYSHSGEIRVTLNTTGGQTLSTGGTAFNTVVPEPSTSLLGLLAIGFLTRRKR